MKQKNNWTSFSTKPTFEETNLTRVDKFGRIHFNGKFRIWILNFIKRFKGKRGAKLS